MAEASVVIRVDAKDAQKQLQGINAQTGKLSNTFRDAQGKLRGANGQFVAMGKAAGTARQSIQILGTTFSTYLAPLVALGAAVTAFSKSLSVMSDRQKDTAALENGLKGLTTNGAAALADLKRSADELGKATLFDEEDFTKGFKLLTSFRTIGVSSYEEVAETAADMAQVLDQDVNSVLLQVAKALEAPEVGLTALQRSGTRFSDSQKEMVKSMVKANKTSEAQAFILKELQRQYGGAAQAASKGFAGAMDTLGEVTRDAFEAFGKFIEPAASQGLVVLTKVIQKVSAFFKAFADTVMPRVRKALDPFVEKLGEIFSAVPWEQIGNILQNVLIAKFTVIAEALGLIVPLAIRFVDQLVFVLKNSPIGFIVQKVYELATALGLASPLATELAENSEAVGAAYEDVPGQIDQAAMAKQRMLQLGQQELALATKQKAALKEQEASYQQQRSVATARLNAEKAITELAGQQLQRAYEQATTVKQRLAIAKAIYQNQVKLAGLERSAANATINAEMNALELKKRGAQITLKEIEAKGMIAQADAKNLEQATQIAEKTRQAVELQRQAVGLIDGQIQAQERVGELQAFAAEAQFRAKELTARTAYEQRLTSKEIGKSATEARKMADRAGTTAINTNRTNTAMRQVERVTRSTTSEMTALGIQAGNTAAAISSAAAAMERLNRARSGSKGGGGGGGGSPEGAAKGAYWQGGFKAFAKGGVVNRPTLGLIGEGGEPEYIIPSSKAGGFAMNYLSGKRGSAAIPAFAEGGFVGPSSASVSIQTGPVTQMNGQNYVTMQDLGAAVQAGVQQTLTSLRRDGTVRKQLGLA